MAPKIATPSEVLDAIRLVEHIVADHFSPRDERDVIVMHAKYDPCGFWKGGKHNVGLRVFPNLTDDLGLDFQIVRCRGNNTTSDPSWDRSAKALTETLRKGSVLSDRYVLAFKTEVIATDRRSEDARKTGFNDCYTVRVLRNEDHISEHGWDFQNRSHLDAALHQAEV